MTELDAALASAKTMTIDLFGLAAAHGLDLRELPHLLTVPPIVARAYEQWAKQMNDVARLIARQDGIPPGTNLTEADRTRLTVRAFTMVMD